MKEKRFRCRHCHKICCAGVKDQKYCSEKSCQRARQNAWRREKCAVDPDYRANQRASTEKWLSTQGGSAAYFREYRKRRKRAVEARQQELIDMAEARGFDTTEASLFAPDIAGLRKNANSDAMIGESPIKSGRYVIFPARANSDAILVNISLITGS